MLIKSKEQLKQEILGEDTREVALLSEDKRLLDVMRSAFKHPSEHNGLTKYWNNIKYTVLRSSHRVKEHTSKLNIVGCILLYAMELVTVLITVIFYTIVWVSDPLNMFNTNVEGRSMNYSQFFRLNKPPILKTDSRLCILGSNLTGEFMGTTYLHTGDILHEQREEIVESVNILRRAIYSNNLALDGVVLKQVVRKLKSDEYLQFQAIGVLEQPFMTQHVSFGTTLNKAIKVMVDDMVLVEKKGKSYFIIDNGGTYDLAAKLSNIFNEDIHIKLTEG